MKYYFQLQLLRFQRFSKESGFHPAIAFLLLIGIFIFLSHLSINTLKSGNWIYLGLALYLFSKIQNTALIDLIYSNRELRKLRLLEAIIFSVPFSIMLFVKQFFLEGIFLTLLLALFSQISIKRNFSFVIPTPFYKHPFEFIVGFRKAWLLIFITYGLCAIALIVGNHNLALFSVVLIYLTIILFYSNPEPEFFVLIYAMKPKQFLWKKVMTALLLTATLSIPLVLATFITFPEKWITTSLLFLVGPFLPITGILNKYSQFPSDSELINSILIGSCLLFPPILLFIVPYLANKATINLNNHL